MNLIVPKKYQERFDKLEIESDLIDDCKYMLYFADGWLYADYSSVPVISKKEALEFLKDAYKESEGYNDYNERFAKKN